MTFVEVDAEHRDPETLKQWNSEPAGRYRIVMVPMFYGIRCNLMHDWGQRHDAPYTWIQYERVYCLGDHQLSLMLAPRVIMKALADVDESASLSTLARILPEQHRKPLYNDPACCRALFAAAGVPELADAIFADARELMVSDVRDQVFSQEGTQQA